MSVSIALNKRTTAKAATFLAHRDPVCSGGAGRSRSTARVPAPPPISIETKRAPDKTENNHRCGGLCNLRGDLRGPHRPSRVFAVQRKAERVSMTGTNAYAVLGDQGVRRARVLDLGFGGVAMELDSAEDLPENLLAVLHVPILPPFA